MISRKVLRCLILIAEEAIRSVISEMVYIDFFSLISIKMRLIRVTELDDDRYIYHIGVPFGTAEFVVQYIIERLNAVKHTINILCANKNERRNESKCTARLTLKTKEEIWPFFQPGKRLKNRVKYEFKGGKDEIMDINNYEIEHKHSASCKDSVDDLDQCRITKHQMTCLTVTDEFESTYPRIFRREVNRNFKFRNMNLPKPYQ